MKIVHFIPRAMGTNQRASVWIRYVLRLSSPWLHPASNREKWPDGRGPEEVEETGSVVMVYMREYRGKLSDMTPR